MKYLCSILICTIIHITSPDTLLYGQTKRPKHLNNLKSRSFYKKNRKTRLLDFTGAKSTLDIMAIYGKGERTSLAGLKGNYYFLNNVAVFESFSVEWGEIFLDRYRAIYADIGLQWNVIRIGKIAGSISAGPYFSNNRYYGNEKSRLNGHYFGIVGSGKLAYHSNRYQIFFNAQQRRDLGSTYQRFFMGLGAGYSFF